MKLRKIVKKIKQLNQRNESFYDFMKSALPYNFLKLIPGGSFDNILTMASSYMENILLSKSEAALWIESLKDEIKDLKSRIEAMEFESDYAPARERVGYFGFGGVKEFREAIDQMIDEYGAYDLDMDLDHEQYFDEDEISELDVYEKHYD